MIKGYYIHFQGRSSIGISKKIDMQMESLSKYFDICEAEIITPHKSLVERILGLFPTASITRNYQSALDNLEHPNFLYVRRTVADRAYLNFWKKVKEKYPDCKIIIEIFTYPYDKDDFGQWNSWPFYIKELLYRSKLKKYVNRFVTYTEDNEIFGVPTLRTINGVQIDKIEIVKGEYQENRITMMAVAYMQNHHGYERLIEGLRQYYQSKEPIYTVDLLMIGDGPEKPFYEGLVKKYQLQEYVKFYPTMSGEQLDAMYDISDIALASFGMYKKGIYKRLSALKTREYLAKGMPIMTGCEIDVLDEHYPFVRNFPNNAQDIDITDVIKFYEKIKREYTDKSTVARVIRDFAISHVNMDSAMQPIVDYINSAQL